MKCERIILSNKIKEVNKKKSEQPVEELVNV
jgi:hypothetical protein